MRIDTHCHVDQFPRPRALVEAIERQKVATVAVTNLPEHYVAGQPHVQGRRYLRLALGLHPLVAADEHTRQLSVFLRLAAAADYLGEVGLDFSRPGLATKDVQVRSFHRVAECLAQRPRFATVHSRGAETEVLAILREHGAGPVIFHWFSGNADALAAIIADGHYLSVNPAMTLSGRWQQLFDAIPPARVLTETDGPYVQVRGQPAEPVEVEGVLAWLAQRWMVDFAEAQARVNTNYQRLRSTWVPAG